MGTQQVVSDIAAAELARLKFQSDDCNIHDRRTSGGAIFRHGARSAGNHLLVASRDDHQPKSLRSSEIRG